MRNKNEAVPFYTNLMKAGGMGIALTVVTTPPGRVDMFGLSFSYTGLMIMASVASLVFGLVFGLLAAISARRAHVLRMKEQNAQAQADIAVASDSRPEVNLDKSMAAATPASAAVFTMPEPRVMVVESAARPRVEPSLSAKSEAA